MTNLSKAKAPIVLTDGFGKVIRNGRFARFTVRASTVDLHGATAKSTRKLWSIWFMKKNGKPGSNKQKRFQCYVGIAENILKDNNQGFRMLLGWCVMNYVRGAFPEENEENYTGFKYGSNMCPISGEFKCLYQ